MKLICVTALSLAFAGQAYCEPADEPQQRKTPFTVADDIGFTHFLSFDGDYGGEFLGDSGILFSPDGAFVAVLTARGRLDLNEVENSLRFYRAEDFEAYLKQSDESKPPEPVWIVTRLGKKQPISNMSWLSDSSGVALLEYTEGESERIVLADLRKRTTEMLPDQVAKYESFAMSDREHYVYVAEDAGARNELEEKRQAELRAPMWAFTGGTAWWDLLKPENPGVMRGLLSGRKHLWAVQSGQPHEVKHDGAPLDPHDFGFRTLALSPNGKSFVTKMKVKNIPSSWERLYPPPYPSHPDSNIHAGGSAWEFVQVDLKTGALHALMDAPASADAGWLGKDDGAVWSSDGKAIVLSGTFLESRDGQPSQPCVAVVDLIPHASSCVEKLMGRRGPNQELPKGYHRVMSARFVEGDKNRVEIAIVDRDEAAGTIEYRRTGQADWEVIGEQKGIYYRGRNGMEITVKQAFDQPPLLVASEQGHSKVIWDPNPQFRDIDLGRAKTYRWKDKEGRAWQGGLYLPAGYRAGQRYPLVIQTHGFSESIFTPSASFPTAFAGLELAATGIAVLQIGGGENCPFGHQGEAACEVAGFEAGARQLATDGIVDVQNVGYIGFSRTCWYGMEFLTNGTLPLKAALLADGITVDYMLFALTGIDFSDELGAKPFGEGLESWVKRSPGFHLDKVNAPLLIDGQHDWVLHMWQPYAGLKYLKKPVELDLINTDEHLITNPAERMASLGLSVDWFRFWLQGYEDPDPAKAEQYKRWRGLRELQEGNNKKAAAATN